MSSLNPEQANGPTYWRSLDELADTPGFREFLHREFPAGASELLEGDRRNFLKIMGASFALAGLGLTGCRRWPDEKIAPYARRPADRAPGEPEYYATAAERDGVGIGLLVTSYDGRPTKIEGNPEHPISQGASDGLTQASVLDLYDPDRSRDFMRLADGSRTRSTDAAFDAWARDHFATLTTTEGDGLALLTEATSSATMAALAARFKSRFPRASWHEYEPLNNDNVVAGAIGVFGKPMRAQYAFDKARVIVSLDSDFLLGEPAAVKHMRDFAVGRRADGHVPWMSRLYQFEAGLSVTGTNADHRVAVKAGDVALVAGLLFKRLLPDMRPSSDIAVKQFSDGRPSDIGLDPLLFDAMVNDLEQHRGASIIIAGARQPAEVHVLAHRLNEHLGNFGTTVSFTAPPPASSHLASIRSLVGDMQAGKVRTLVMLGGNPVYNAPANLEFSGHLAGVAASIHLSHEDNETSRLCTWHVPRAHFLEAWGDTRSWDGSYSVCQPLIEPLFGGRSPIEIVAQATGDNVTAGYDLVRRTFASTIARGSDELVWRRALHDGLAGHPAATETPRVRRDDVRQFLDALWENRATADPTADEVVFARDHSVHDGRFANNGWLQELPDPITKLTWDNAVLMGPGKAEALGVHTGDMVTVTMPNKSATELVPVMIVPGHHPDSVTLPLGYGRTAGGRISDGAGFNFYKVRTAETMGFASGTTITKASGHYTLATTQDHHAIDSAGGQGTQDRLPSLVRAATFQKFSADPHFAAHAVHVPHRLSIWKTDLMADARYRWGMSIDLATCTGCSACVVACQAENNIPVVGKDQIVRGREMHWMRVDRYFKGDPHTPEAALHQPVNCLMCENAPCEQVCPVAATTHDKQGLNVMVYNRCIGTRYCSNNCPYKVRRFNYFDYQVRRPHREKGGLMHVDADYYTRKQSDTHPLHQLQFNPEVTVRSRGVMEKCTYCIQRISDARIKTKNEWVKKSDREKQADPRVTIPDGTFTTACAQACPAEAIKFGDLNDTASEVHAAQQNPRAYEMLEEIHTKPRTRYLARLTNPAPQFDGGSSDPDDDGTHHG